MSEFRPWKQVRDQMHQRRAEKVSLAAEELLKDVASRMEILPTDYLAEAVAAALDIVQERQESGKGPLETIPSVEWSEIANELRKLH